MCYKKIIQYSIMLCLLGQVKSYGQNASPYLGEVRKVMSAIKDIKEIGYKYSLSANYPNGEHDQVKGEVMMNNEDKLMFNTNDAFTIIYDGNWFYKADHRQKIITLINLGKHMNKSFKQGLEKDIFGNATMSVFADSVIAKYALLNKLKNEGDTTYMDLRFPQQMPIKNINIVYDEHTRIPVSFRTETFQPWPTNEYGKNKGISQVVTCSGFIRGIDKSACKTDRYFQIVKGEVVLKKYNSYKLNAKL